MDGQICYIDIARQYADCWRAIKITLTFNNDSGGASAKRWNSGCYCQYFCSSEITTKERNIAGNSYFNVQLLLMVYVTSLLWLKSWFWVTVYSTQINYKDSSVSTDRVSGFGRLKKVHKILYKFHTRNWNILAFHSQTYINLLKPQMWNAPAIYVVTYIKTRLFLMRK